MNALASSSRAELITARDDISRALLDQLATCVVLLDENRGIVILNTAAETLLEASAARLGGSDIAQVIDLDDTLDSLLSQALENNYPVVKRELDILLRGGQRFCVDFVVSPISLEQAPHLLLEFNPVDRLNSCCWSSTPSTGLTLSLKTNTCGKLRHPCARLSAASRMR